LAEVSFRLVEEQGNVEICIHNFAPPLLTAPEIKRMFDMSEFRECHFLQERVAGILAVLPDKPTPMLGAESETAMEPLFFDIAEKKDAEFTLEVDDAFMQVVAHYTTHEGGEGVTLEEIVKQLKAIGAVKGLDKDAIRRLFDRTKKERPGTSFSEILAQGKAVGDGEESTFEYIITPLEDRVLEPQKRDDGTLDMRDLGDIETVKKGDPLMRRIPSQPGENGYTIQGEVLVAKAPDGTSFNIGEGVSKSPTDTNLLVADRAGVPLKVENGISVSEALVLKNVDLTTGNVEYDGAVIVLGNVTGGMQIKATRDVMIHGFVELGIIESDRNIIVHKGVLGGEADVVEVDDGSVDEDADDSAVDEFDIAKTKFTTQLIAKKNISSLYAQSAYLEAGNDVSIVTQLLNCHVKSGNGVYVGDKGQKKSKLVGGVIRAGKEVTSGEIGAPSNTQMTIDFSHRVRGLEKKYLEVKKEYAVQTELVEGLREALEKLKAQNPTPELIRHCKKIVGTIQTVKQGLISINLDEQATNVELNKLRAGIKVSVYGRLYPGANFIVGDQHYSNNEERGGCVVRFDSEKMLIE